MPNLVCLDSNWRKVLTNGHTILLTIRNNSYHLHNRAIKMDRVGMMNPKETSFSAKRALLFSLGFCTAQDL